MIGYYMCRYISGQDTCLILKQRVIMSLTTWQSDLIVGLIKLDACQFAV